MGLFNILTVDAKCPWCGKESSMEVQFKYGKLWQYKYKIGDPITWATERQAKSVKQRVSIPGVAMPCKYCVKDFIDFEITIEKNIVTSAYPRPESP
jgi:hypothetical protein